jgi:mono/diheme cytochrome c family protein
MKHPRHLLSIGAFLGLAAIAASCGRDPNDPGIQYAPEMYESIPYEPFKQVKDSTTPFADGRTLQAPPDGTVPRGGYLEGFEFGPGDSIKAGAEVIAYPNPVPATQAVLDEGKVLYDRFCAVCHGAAGKGDGPVTKNPAIKPSPYTSDKLKVYTDGQIYHTIMYGQGVMGSYASQVQYEDRWKIVHFVKTLQGNTAANDSVPADTIPPAAPAVDAAPVGGNPGDHGH